MCLAELDIHSNLVTTEGFCKLMVCLAINNKVKRLNVSKNQISADFKMFKQVQRFLSSNNTLEHLDLSFCELHEKAGKSIGKGLRGNRNLQSLILKGNPIKEGVIEIAKAFNQNKKALCLKELDISKCQIQCQHITKEFVEMIKSPYTFLKTLSVRDNLIKYQGSQDIRDALEGNKRITKLQIDYNPIKQEVAEQIDKLCKRNKELDEISQKNKNVYELA